MTLIDLLLLLLIACICGSIAMTLAGFTRGGCAAAIAVGFIGALAGRWLAQMLALPDVLTVNLGGTSFPIIWSIIGGSLFAAVLGLLTRSVRRDVI